MVFRSLFTEIRVRLIISRPRYLSALMRIETALNSTKMKMVISMGKKMLMKKI